MTFNQPRVIFMGSPAFAVPSLTALAERPDICQVVGVVTQPDRPAGRGQKLMPSAVKVAATARGIPVMQFTKMRAEATRQALAELEPDVMVVVAYGRILPPSLLTLAPRGCVNVHASLLPRHRGASPIAHAIMAGDEVTGVSIMKMDEGLDTGPVFATRELPIEPEDTCGSLTLRLSVLGAEALVQELPSILAEDAKPTPQDDHLATLAPLLSKEEGRIDFGQPALALERRVRGLFPWPGSFTTRGDQRVVVLGARAVAEGAAGAPPGTVIDADAAGVLVACGVGALRLTLVKPAGKKEMTASAWIAGRGVQIGDRLGAL